MDSCQPVTDNSLSSITPAAPVPQSSSADSAPLNTVDLDFQPDRLITSTNLVDLSTDEPAAKRRRLDDSKASKALVWNKVDPEQGKMPPPPAPSMVASAPSSQRSDLRSEGSFRTISDPMDVDILVLPSHSSDEMRQPPAAKIVDTQPDATLATAASQQQVQPAATPSATAPELHIQPAASTLSTRSPRALQPLPLPTLPENPAYCCEPREMVLPPLYYRFEPARATEWLVPADYQSLHVHWA